jgi:hypothetical protein
MVNIRIHFEFLIWIFCLLRVFWSHIYTIGFQVKNKQHINSRHLASYLAYGTEGVVRVKSKEIRISETNHLNVGLVGETVLYVYLLLILSFASWTFFRSQLSSMDILNISNLRIHSYNRGAAICLWYFKRLISAVAREKLSGNFVFSRRKEINRCVFRVNDMKLLLCVLWEPAVQSLCDSERSEYV